VDVNPMIRHQKKPVSHSSHYAFGVHLMMMNLHRMNWKDFGVPGLESMV
jgi:hypothetical protein